MVKEIEFNDAMWIATTHYAHEQKAQQMGGKLTFAQVARETGLHPKTVAHWYSLGYKQRLNPEFLVLLDYYGMKFKHAFALRFPDGRVISGTEVSKEE